MRYEFYVSQNPTAQKIVQIGNLHDCPFQPTFYLSNGHLQSLACWQVRKFYQPEQFWNFTFKRQEYNFKHSAKGMTSIDWVIPNTQTQEDIAHLPVLILLLGYTGNNNEIYSINFAKEGIKNKFRVCVVNHRGCSFTKITTPQLYNAGYTQDLRQIVHDFYHNRGLKDIYAIGFSMGANVLIKYAGEQGKNCVLKGIVSICNPFKLYECYLPSEKALFGLYGTFVKRNIKRKLKLHREMLQQLEEPLNFKYDDLLQEETRVIEIDEKLLAPHLGYKNAEDYHLRASCNDYVKKVEIPVLYLNANDDPLARQSAIPRQCLRTQAPCAITMIYNCGGHIGFISGINKLYQWVHQPVYRYLQGVKMTCKAKSD